MRNRTLVIVGLICLGVGVTGLALLGTGRFGPRVAAGDAVARGTWVYRTGTDPDGRPIPYAGGMMMSVACANCHGVDGHGLRTPMFIGPDITYRNLTDPNGMLEPDGARGPTYTDEFIRQAVTQGIDADDKTLAWTMPRWRLTDQQWQDLLVYLRTLP